MAVDTWERPDRPSISRAAVRKTDCRRDIWPANHGPTSYVSVIKSDDCNIHPVRVFIRPLGGSPWNFVTAVGSKNYNDAAIRWLEKLCRYVN